MNFCSPHPRGWSTSGAFCYPSHPLLPAPAGMVPRRSPRPRRCRPAPRTRGDGPGTASRIDRATTCSPHPRGWSPRPLHQLHAVPLLPAPAGMVPRSTADQPRRATAPRTRGDGPHQARRSGDGDACSPHPRGWSRGPHHHRPARHLLPAPAGMVPLTAPSTYGPGLLLAPAGMVPAARTCARERRTAPCTRRDGPRSSASRWRPAICSPHPQGCRLMATRRSTADAVAQQRSAVPRAPVSARHGPSQSGPATPVTAGSVRCPRTPTTGRERGPFRPRRPG